jgi:hypothetical protein
MRKQTLILTVVAMMMLTGMVFAEPMTYTGSYDIGELMAKAEAAYDLSQQDVIYLIEGREDTWTADGRRSTKVHRVVWISSDLGIEEFADLRIPYDLERQNFDVETLRVWRDNRWINNRETAIVKTLPAAVASAPDYTNLREMMLLHDGVQLPCILECAYVIEDKEPYRKGMEDVFFFQYEHPVMRSALLINKPAGSEFMYNASASLGESIEGTTDGMDTMLWIAGPFEPAPVPELDDAVDILPNVTYSTWGNWEAFGKDLKAAFETNYDLDDELKGLLKETLDGAVSPVDKANRIARFVGDNTRYIDYDTELFWSSIRKPARIYSTAYANRLDRAVLMAALVKEAGLEVWPVFMAKAYGDIDDGIPTDSRMDEVGLWMSSEGLEAYYCPEASEVMNGLAPIFGKAIWLPGSEDTPKVRWSGKGTTSTMVVKMDLSYCSEKEKFYGKGYFNSEGGLCPYDRMEGLCDESRSYLEGVTKSILGKAKVKGYNPTSFDRFSVATGFKFKSDASARDNMDRIVLNVTSPAEGISGSLPNDVHLYQDVRETPVLLPGTMMQKVCVSLDLGDLELVSLPEEKTIENGAGKFILKVVNEDGKVTLKRKLSLTKQRYEAAEWAELRALLLADADASNGLIVVK